MRRIVWVIIHPEDGYLRDTCAGGSFSWDLEEALHYESFADAESTALACDIELGCLDIETIVIED